MSILLVLECGVFKLFLFMVDGTFPLRINSVVFLPDHLAILCAGRSLTLLSMLVCRLEYCTT